MWGNRYLVIGLVLMGIGILGVTAVNSLSGSIFHGGMRAGMAGRMMGGGMMQCQEMMGGMMKDMMKNMGEIDKKREFSSNGERIFYTGINSKGEAVKNSHGMQGVGCAMCHGADANGMRMMMMDVPPLRWDYLTDPEGHIHSNGRKHPPFTEDSFKVCVSVGFDSGGNELGTMMPRWEMSGEDLDSLIDYLKKK